MRTTATDEARVALGELAARLDDRLTLVLGLHYGREIDHVLSLVQDVMWRVSIEERIKLLDAALWRTGLHDEVPFLVPSLAEVFRVRNLVAHSITYGQTDDALTLLSIRGGKRKQVTLPVAKLRWATRVAEVCGYLYLSRIEGRIGDLGTWGQLYGLDEH